MLFIKDIKLFFKDKYGLLSLIFIFTFQSGIILYSQSNTLAKAYLNSVDGVFIFFTKIVIIVLTLIFLSSFLQVIYQYSPEKENFLLARSLPSGVRQFIKSKVLLSNIILILVTQPFYWTMVIMNDFHNTIEIRFLNFCSFVLLFTTLNLTIYSSYYVLAKAKPCNNFILSIKFLIKLTLSTVVNLIISATIVILPIIYIYKDSGFNKFYEYSNIIFISLITLHFIMLLTSRHSLNKASEMIQNSET